MVGSQALLLLLGTSIPMLAVPAWARLTGVSCADCHAVPTLQLTAMGLEFQRNGARLDPTSLDESSQKLTSVRLKVEQWQLFREGVFTDPNFSLRKGPPELDFLENGDR